MAEVQCSVVGLGKAQAYWLLYTAVDAPLQDSNVHLPRTAVQNFSVLCNVHVHVHVRVHVHVH